MGPNPFAGVLFHWTGGLSSASCYLPFRWVHRWSWETSWFVQGLVSFLLAPIVAALLLVPGVFAILRQASWETLALTFFWGVLWGIGGLTFGLSIRYLGYALGYAIALGLTAAFGTVMPPLFAGEMPALIHHRPGQIILLGVAVCLAGIALSGMAGYQKERELTPAEKERTVAEFNFPKGILVAIFAGVMSACFAYGLATGKPIGNTTRAVLLTHGGASEWQNLPILIVVLLGGLTTNALWCLILMTRNRTGLQMFGTTSHVLSNASASATRPNAEPEPGVLADPALEENAIIEPPARLSVNYLLCACVGLLWYLQFFFYSIGQTKMGKYDFSSWTLHMASIIIFSTLWGIWLKEWHGTSRKTKVLVALGLAVLIFSTILVGYGNYLNVRV